MSKSQQKRICAQAECAVKDMLQEKNKRLRKALLTSPCPYPIVTPFGYRTVEECINADKCGCDNKVALDE